MRTTKRQFRLFETECRRLQEAWGLQDWELKVWHTKLQTGQGSCIDAGLQCRDIQIWFTTETPPGIRLNDDDIMELARHEMTHALLQPVATMLRNRIRKDKNSKREFEVVNGAEHEVVHRLMRLLPR